MPPWEKTGVPGDVALTHFHSSTISGSASWMMSRTFASIFPRQSPSSLILASRIAEPESAGPEFFMGRSKSRNYFNQAPHVCALSAQELALSERSESKGGINLIYPFP